MEYIKKHLKTITANATLVGQYSAELKVNPDNVALHDNLKQAEEFLRVAYAELYTLIEDLHNVKQKLTLYAQTTEQGLNRMRLSKERPPIELLEHYLDHVQTILKNRTT